MESLWIKKIKRIVKLPHFHYTIFQKLEVIPTHSIPTAAVYRGKIYLNPGFISSLPINHVNAVIEHEINHFNVFNGIKL